MKVMIKKKEKENEIEEKKIEKKLKKIEKNQSFPLL